MDKPHELSQSFQSVFQKSRTLHISLLKPIFEKSKPLAGALTITSPLYCHGGAFSSFFPFSCLMPNVSPGWGEGVGVSSEKCIFRGAIS